ncbi:MAG: FecR domain-containing protein, partial [Akkermansiaceae bacterium]|nr:FecR domain-containing protein [Akkermansiaceae bacterium]
MNARLHHLIEQHLTGRLTSSEEKELHQLLSESAENRDIFCIQGVIDGRLRWEMENGISELTPVDAHKSQPATKRCMARRWMAIAALVILTLIAGSLIRTQFGSSDTGDPQPGNQTANVASAYEPIRTVARLTAEKEAYWLINGTQQTLASGSWLSPGEWSITQGTATITLDSGAKITAVAPVCVELINSNHARLIDGTVSVDVPEPAIGFTLDTPAGRIVDLSTRFSVSVEKGQHEEVHVLEGEVIVHYGDDHQQSQLIGNQSAIRLNKSGRSSKLSPASFRPGSYPREVAFTPASLTQERGYVHWSFDAQDEARVFEADGTLEGAQSCNA